MSTITTYPAGVPCWIDTYQPDPQAAARFYGGLLGWTFDEPVPMPDGMAGDYRTARVGDRLVAGIGQAPEGFPSAVWTTYVAVDDVTTTTTEAEAAGGGRVPDAPTAFWRLPGHVGGEPEQPMPRDVVAVLAPISDGDPTPPHWSVAIMVDDVDATASSASDLGGTVLLAPMDTPGFRTAVVADPQGGVAAITSPTTEN